MRSKLGNQIKISTPKPVRRKSWGGCEIICQKSSPENRPSGRFFQSIFQKLLRVLNLKWDTQYISKLEFAVLVFFVSLDQKLHGFLVVFSRTFLKINIQFQLYNLSQREIIKITKMSIIQDFIDGSQRHRYLFIFNQMWTTFDCINCYLLSIVWMEIFKVNHLKGVFWCLSKYVLPMLGIIWNNICQQKVWIKTFCFVCQDLPIIIFQTERLKNNQEYICVIPFQRIRIS